MKRFYFLIVFGAASMAYGQFVIPGQTQTNVTITEKRDFYSQYRDVASANANNAIAQAQLAEATAMQAKLRAEYEAKAVANPSLDLKSGYQSSKNRNYCSGRRKISVWIPSTWDLVERPNVEPWGQDEYPVLGAVRVYEDNTKIVMNVGTICSTSESGILQEYSKLQEDVSRGILGILYDEQSVITFIIPNGAASLADVKIGDQLIEVFNLTADAIYDGTNGKPGDEIALKLSRNGSEIVRLVELKKHNHIHGALTVDGMNGYFIAEEGYFERFGEIQHLIDVKNVFFDKTRGINWIIAFQIVAPDAGATFEYNWKRFRPLVATLVENFDVQ